MIRVFRIVLILLLAFTPLSSGYAEPMNPYEQYRAGTFETQQVYLKRITDHQAKIMDDLEQKLKQQQWQTTVISVMVVVMVLCGLGLSAMQFYLDFRSNGRSSMTFKFGSGSFELSSTVIFIGILALSFWFFQTYVDKVYSVKITTVPPIDVTTYGHNH